MYYLPVPFYTNLLISPLPVAKLHEVIGAPTIADAICDRIIHNAHRIELKGESSRKKYTQIIDSNLTLWYGCRQQIG